MNAYSVNHMTRSIILTRDFTKKACIADTDEYKLLIKLRTDNPGYDIIQRTITKKEGKRKPSFAFFIAWIEQLPPSVQEKLARLKFVLFKNKGYNYITRLGMNLTETK